MEVEVGCMSRTLCPGGNSPTLPLAKGPGGPQGQSGQPDVSCVVGHVLASSLVLQFVLYILYVKVNLSLYFTNDIPQHEEVGAIGGIAPPI
jgi:hypothetical protein